MKKASLWIIAVLIDLVQAADAPVNFLFITVDDMNWDSPGVYGNKLPDITPTIDQLAADGMKFDQAYVTAAICMPSRQSLMTGRYPHNNGAPGFDPIADSIPNIIELLKKAGYVNGVMGKEGHYTPLNRYPWDQVTRMTVDLGNGRDAEKFYEHAKTFFNLAKTSGKPFFLKANASDPHRPLAGTGVYKAADVQVPGFLFDEAPVREEIAQYYSSVHRADRVVKRILEALEESGYKENTMVTFLSDHGMPFVFAKSNVYMHSNRTPWIVRWPGVVKPGSVDTAHMISGLDFMPTILEIAGIPRGPKLNGRSFLPVLKGGKMGGFDRVFSEINLMVDKVPAPMRAVTTKKFGYIWNKWSDGRKKLVNDGNTGLISSDVKYWEPLLEIAKMKPAIQKRIDFYWYRVPEEFYDYEKDPDALNNLIGEPAYQDIIKGMKQDLLNEMFMTADSLLKPFQILTGMKGKAVPVNRGKSVHKRGSVTFQNGQLRIDGADFRGLAMKLKGINGESHELVQNGKNSFRAVRRLSAGIYFLGIHGHSYSILVR